MKVADTNTIWANVGRIPEISAVGKEAICFGSGCHLIFINLVTYEHQLYTANNKETGDGIKCFSGHRSFPIFGVIENCSNPNIFIKNYPQCEDISILRNGCEYGFIKIAFSETSLLVTLGDLPFFPLIIWNWRKGEKIATQNTSILVQNQLLRCNLNSPLYTVQLGLETKHLHLWDSFICGKKCVLTQHVIQLPPEGCDVFTDVLWTTDGGLFVLDCRGCVYTVVQSNHTLEKVIEFSGPGRNLTCFAWHKAGLTIFGPDDQIRRYRKSGNWLCEQTMASPEPVKMMTTTREYLVALTTNNNLIEVRTAQNELKYIKQQGSNFIDICMVQPVGEYIVALCANSSLSVFEIATGAEISKLVLGGNSLAIGENPLFPYVAVTYDNGTLDLISVYHPKKIEKIASFYLTRNPIDSIYFVDCGRIFVAANLSVGEFFVLEGLPGSTIEVVASINLRCQIADYMMVISKSCYRLFSIPVTSQKYMAGNKIVRHCIIKNESTTVKEYTFENVDAPLYWKICATMKINRDRVFYVVPQTARVIHQIEIKKNVNTSRILQVVPTGHQMRQVQVKLNKNFALTWSYDGFVILRDSNFSKEIGIALPHHRTQGGVQKALVDPYNKHIISLGKDNIIACTSLLEYEIDPSLKSELSSILRSPAYGLLFKKRTTGLIQKDDNEPKCWLELQDMQRIENERLFCKKERDQIFADFQAIKTELQALLTTNLEGPDNEKLDLTEFNLDTKLYEGTVEYQRQLRKSTDKYYRELIEANNRVSKWLIENFLDKMKVPGTAIKAIFAHFDVENFVLLPEDVAMEELLKWIQEFRKLEVYSNNLKPFQPWGPLADSECLEAMMKPPEVFEETTHATVVLNEDDKEVTQEDDKNRIENKIAYSGSDIQRFVEIESTPYEQSEVQSYLQAELQSIISKADIEKIKRFFNKDFDSTMNMKIREVANIKDRNARLRHIISERNYFSADKADIIIEDPEWAQEEIPELIKQVKDNEVAITPYISPSEQGALDAQAAEAERLRLLLLADDFRERALMAMMNGVLEVRWEDELRKEVSVPKCMTSKDPETFNEDDLRTVKDYEEKVKFLNSERERYKKILESEYGRIAKEVREGVRKFNLKLEDLLLLKLKVEAAIGQETLKVSRTKLNQKKRRFLQSKEEDTGQLIVDNENVIRSLYELVSSLQESIEGDCKSQVEALATREKFLEKAFKKDFQDMSAVIQEQATKLYKKRPKASIRNVNSATTLHELSKCIPTRTISLTLNQECIDFLKSLDNLELYIGVPPMIDEHTYNLICKHRRLKIEHEVKLKSAISEVTEGQNTIATFQKRLAQKKELQHKLIAKLEEIRIEKLRKVRYNIELQLVVQQGLVEVPMTGKIEDFSDSILVRRKDVEDINRIILEYGDKKLKSMLQTMTFRRRIISMEWQHTNLKMQIEDLQEKISDIKNVKVTKEMQAYLKCKSLGQKDTTLPFETEVEMIKASYENTIKERKDIVRKLKTEIRALKEDNKVVDLKITEVNVDVCEYNLLKDHTLDEKEKEVVEARMKTLLARNKMVRQIQSNHNEILVLQTELELLRLKTFPTLKYRIFN